MNGKRMGLFIAYALLTPLMLLIQYVYPGTVKGLDLALVLACSAGWFSPLPASGVIGFGIGLIQDLFVGRIIGFSALSLSVVSMSMSWVRGFLNPAMPFASSIATMISTGVGDFTAYVVLQLLSTPVSWEFFIRDMLPYSLIWSFTLIIPVNLVVNGVAGILAMVWPDSTKEVGRISHEHRL
ncbi:MAG TPA: hypothetical protein GX529_02145 [Firmicutes bacterium]|nr:hypothetical protein [Candidatus Fermentithermobacillaceae bacterium]